MKHLLDWFCWCFWRRFPQYLPSTFQQEILSLSPFLCQQIGQGSPMIVMRRETWDAGGCEEVPGAPTNRDGEIWIMKKWLKDNPDWRPSVSRNNSSE